MPSLKVFISYSHEDKDNIAPVVDLLRATMKNSVFQDYRDIEPGRKWREKLLDALHKARTVVVFWCAHSSKSDFVKEEYEFAINADKEVMPLLMDDTQLPADLSDYQWIDFRRFQFHSPPAPPAFFAHPEVHHYPKDEWGNYVDWDSQDHAERLSKHDQLLEQDRMAAVKVLIEELEKRSNP